MLQRITVNPTNAFLRCEALRELAVDALRHRQTDAALSLSKQLLQETNSTFRDRLLRLDVLQHAQPAGFQPALASFQREATTNSGKIYELATWQMLNTSPRDALTWLRTLPANMQTNQVVELLVADCCTALRDWLMS